MPQRHDIGWKKRQLVRKGRRTPMKAANITGASGLQLVGPRGPDAIAIDEANGVFLRALRSRAGLAREEASTTPATPRATERSVRRKDRRD